MILSGCGQLDSEAAYFECDYATHKLIVERDRSASFEETRSSCMNARGFHFDQEKFERDLKAGRSGPAWRYWRARSFHW